MLLRNKIQVSLFVKICFYPSATFALVRPKNYIAFVGICCVRKTLFMSKKKCPCWLYLPLSSHICSVQYQILAESELKSDRRKESLQV